MADQGFPGGLGNLLQQAQQMARQMQEKQEQIEKDLESRTVEASAGGGMVTVTATGSGRITAVKIDPAVVDPSDITMLQDLVQAAVNEALRKAQELAGQERGKLSMGLPLPGGLNLGDLFK